MFAARESGGARGSVPTGRANFSVVKLAIDLMSIPLEIVQDIEFLLFSEKVP